MAWTERLPSGKHRGVYRDAQGRRRSAGTFGHKAEALRKASAAEEDARRRTRRDPDAWKQPWGEWAKTWWAARDVAPTTAKADEVRRRLHLEPRWENVPIGEITRHDVKDWIADLRTEGRSPELVRRIVHLFSASMVAAMDAEIIEANPAARLKLAGGAKAQERYLEREEYEAIREQLPTTGDQLLADLLVYTGMRWGELAGLHWSRVNLLKKQLRVAETFDEVDGRIKAYPKGKRIREVPLTDALVEALGEAGGRGGCGVEHVAGVCRSSLVLTTETGRPVRNSNWSVVWRNSVERAGVGHVRIHDLRHTYASWLLQRGVALAEVGRLLGHVSTQTTARYAHLAETPWDDIRSALEQPTRRVE
ncbi:site-specific integrase [Nocardioides sp. TRM66260-LWL]|uniref:tyrosine-type recombinase/integrase n=1 Tax=Nocardioides sp. TRM66260-LWL TaxID=2874478 RepID=UPI001CC701A3|nr:site-specific integrase [Nocardioides sp. TRM66260-LWL]MBZ5735035.1 site-specific integrase [Nocardioides sp. TRM66260-LWL]